MEDLLQKGQMLIQNSPQYLQIHDITKDYCPAVASYFVYKVIMDLSSIDHMCINPIGRIGLIHK